MIFSRKNGNCWLLALGAVCVLLVAGCRYGSHNNSETAYVRLINAVPDAGGLDVSVNGKRVWTRALYRSSTGYQAVSSGTYPITIDASILGTTLLSEPLSFANEQTYTVVALGQASGGFSPTVQVWAENPHEPLPPGKAGVRLINAAPGTPALDLVVNNIVGLKSAVYGARSQRLTLDGGQYDLQIAVAGRPDILLGPVSVLFETGHSYTLVAMGQTANRRLSLQVFPDRQ
jgi:hypothetical protein